MFHVKAFNDVMKSNIPKILKMWIPQEQKELLK